MNSNRHFPDPDAEKAKFDVNQNQLHTRGVPGLWSQLLDLLIVLGVSAVIIGILLWIF
ncbi:hypothetical protein J7E73_21060 [Paenibacillus albidus]|uniref:hypothetical protein n=1 Tax=Paenibacillus albidus TaxID=2041023 RepID=UPI001BE86122|nr:hypothetical protein [Paenibacillus albidus]MBT2291568.1 hypothetical protein [Paenibacillus albidus]